MNREALVEAAVACVRARGVGADEAAPALFRLLWSLGVFVPPPHFLGFVSLASLMGGCFALGVAPVAVLAMVGVWLAASDQLTLRDALAIAAGMSLAAGGLFGMAMAVWFRWRARRLSLPSWKRFAVSRGVAT
jgi:hypothetical protein